MSGISGSPSTQPICGGRLVNAVLLATLTVAAGCGGVSHGDRVALEGTVTLKGEPLDVNATIYFNPPAGQAGIGSSAEVSGGKFSIPEESGPSPGQTLDVIVITAPGIPADGTPKDQIKLPATYKSTVTIPSRDEGQKELQISL